MIKDQVTIHAFTDENGVHFKVNIPEDKIIRNMLRTKITIDDTFPKLSFVDQLLNGDSKLQNSGISFDLGMLGINNVAVVLINDGKRVCSFYVHEDDIQIEGFSFMYESEDSVSIQKEPANEITEKVEDYKDSDNSNDEVVLTVASNNFIFEFEAYNDFLLSTMNISSEGNSVKQCNKLKVKALKSLINRSLELDSPLNTKSNKKALGYLSKAPKQIMLLVAESLVNEYNKK